MAPSPAAAAAVPAARPAAPLAPRDMAPFRPRPSPPAILEARSTDLTSEGSTLPEMEITWVSSRPLAMAITSSG